MAIYGDLSRSKVYHADRGNTAWALADDGDLLIALLRGSEFVDFSFRESFPGIKTGLRAQLREWPREWAYDIDGNTIPPDVIPEEAEFASYEAGLRELTAQGSLMPDVVLGRQIKSASVDGAVSVEYTGATGLNGARPFVSIIAGILAPILTGTARSSVTGSTVRG